MRDRKAYKKNCYIQTSHKPACSRTFYFQSSLEIVEHAYENKIHGALLTASARGWEWEKREVDVLSFSFSRADFARLVVDLRKIKDNDFRTGLYKHQNKQTNKRLIALLDILREYHL